MSSFTLDVVVIDGFIFGNLMQIEVAMRESADRAEDTHPVVAAALRAWADSLSEHYGNV